MFSEIYDLLEEHTEFGEDWGFFNLANALTLEKMFPESIRIYRCFNPYLRGEAVLIESETTMATAREICELLRGVEPSAGGDPVIDAGIYHDIVDEVVREWLAETWPGIHRGIREAIYDDGRSLFGTPQLLDHYGVDASPDLIDYLNTRFEAAQIAA